MKDSVLLISMPFADVSISSLALSQLKAIVQEEAEVSCDVLYLNMALQGLYRPSRDLRQGEHVHVVWGMALWGRPFWR